jgi:hypothetical protein
MSLIERNIILVIVIGYCCFFTDTHTQSVGADKKEESNAGSNSATVRQDSLGGALECVGSMHDPC